MVQKYVKNTNARNFARVFVLFVCVCVCVKSHFTNS